MAVKCGLSRQQQKWLLTAPAAFAALGGGGEGTALRRGCLMGGGGGSRGCQGRCKLATAADAAAAHAAFVAAWRAALKAAAEAAPHTSLVPTVAVAAAVCLGGPACSSRTVLPDCTVWLPSVSTACDPGTSGLDGGQRCPRRERFAHVPVWLKDHAARRLSSASVYGLDQMMREVSHDGMMKSVSISTLLIVLVHDPQRKPCGENGNIRYESNSAAKPCETAQRTSCSGRRQVPAGVRPPWSGCARREHRRTGRWRHVHRPPAQELDGARDALLRGDGRHVTRDRIT